MTRALETFAANDGHLVHFYEDSDELRETVSAHLMQALRSGQVAVVIATREHIAAFEQDLSHLGLEMERARASGSWITLDAKRVLGVIMPGGELDAAAFEQAVGGQVRAALAGERRVCAYGEMVQLLWSAGHIPAAIELEQLWNELRERLPFSLLCAYHRESVSSDDQRGALHRICGLHTATLRRFAPDREAPRNARRFVAEVLRDTDHDHAVVADAQLVLSELASNAVLHAGTPFSVIIRVDGARVRLEVRDSKRQVLVPRRIDRLTSSGRGLALVAALSDAWGFELDPDGKTVWAEFAA